MSKASKDQSVLNEIFAEERELAMQQAMAKLEVVLEDDTKRLAFRAKLDGLTEGTIAERAEDYFRRYREG